MPELQEHRRQKVGLLRAPLHVTKANVGRVWRLCNNTGTVMVDNGTHELVKANGDSPKVAEECHRRE